MTLKKIRALNNPWEYKFFFFSPVEKSKEMKTRSLLFLIPSYFDRSPPSPRDALGKIYSCEKESKDMTLRYVMLFFPLPFPPYLPVVSFSHFVCGRKKKENKKCIFVTDEELNTFFPRQGEGKMLKKG